MTCGVGEDSDAVVDRELRTERIWALVAAAVWVTVPGMKTVWPF